MTTAIKEAEGMEGRQKSKEQEEMKVNYTN